MCIRDRFTYIAAKKANTLYWWRLCFLVLLATMDVYLLACMIVNCIVGAKAKKAIPGSVNQITDSRAVAAAKGVEIAPTKLDSDSQITFDQNAPIPTIPEPTSITEVLAYAFCYKPRLHTPFTTSHSRLSRGARGLINVLVLSTIFAFNGMFMRLGN